MNLINCIIYPNWVHSPPQHRHARDIPRRALSNYLAHHSSWWDHYMRLLKLPCCLTHGYREELRYTLSLKAWGTIHCWKCQDDAETSSQLRSKRLKSMAELYGMNKLPLQTRAELSWHSFGDVLYSVAFCVAALCCSEEKALWPCHSTQINKSNGCYKVNGT